jgi:hypothetical protein
MHVHTVFVPYSPSVSICPPPPPLTGINQPSQDLFSLLVLWLCIRKLKNDIHGCLRWL